MSSLSGTPGRGRLPVAPRDKRPALAALAVLLILLGALGSALLVFRSGDRVSVLVAAENISFGQTIEQTDLRSVRVAADEGLVVEARHLDAYVDSVATSAIPAGTIINRNMFSKRMEDLIPQGAENVGIVLDAEQRPSTMPKPGDVVRLYRVSDDVGDQPVLVDAARVMAVGRGGSAGTRGITVLLSKADASRVAKWAANGDVAVTLLPGGIAPDPDYVQPVVQAADQSADE